MDENERSLNSIAGHEEPISILRRAGFIAIAAGAVGLISVGLLISGLVARPFNPDVGRIGIAKVLIRGQDVAVALQALLMLLVIVKTMRIRTPLRQVPLVAGVGILGQAGVLLMIALVFASRAFWADMLYMLPQGLIGLWLIAVCWSSSGLSKSMRAIGVLAGIGLVLLSTGTAIIVNALGWEAFDLSASARPTVPPEAWASQGNRLGHQILPFGTLLGRILYPVWTIMVGYKLFRHGAPARKD